MRIRLITLATYLVNVYAYTIRLRLVNTTRDKSVGLHNTEFGTKLSINTRYVTFVYSGEKGHKKTAQSQNACSCQTRAITGKCVTEKHI